MDLGGEDTSVAEMGPSDRKSETSRLVAPNPETSPSYLNILSNICGLVFLGIILYCCFKDDVTLFSFHPTLMTLGVSVPTMLVIFKQYVRTLSIF